MNIKKELNNEELDSISGGNSTLEKYLKSIEDLGKQNKLVDEGTGTQLDLNPSINYEENNNVYVIKREKDNPEI